MTNTQELLKIIDKSGVKKCFLASKLGISAYGLQRKIENKSQFKAEEIKILCNLLNITSLKEREKIFFAKDVDKMST